MRVERKQVWDHKLVNLSWRWLLQALFVGCYSSSCIFCHSSTQHRKARHSVESGKVAKKKKQKKHMPAYSMGWWTCLFTQKNTCVYSILSKDQQKSVSSKTGKCLTPSQLLICSSFSRENGYLLLICSSLSTSQKRNILQTIGLEGPICCFVRLIWIIP